MKSREMQEKVVGPMIARVGRLLGKKGDAYSRGGDRLSHFKRAAELLRTTPERALIGMVGKHITAVIDMVEDVPEGSSSDALWDEKIGDIITYMILLRGLVKEREELKGRYRRGEGERGPRVHPLCRVDMCNAYDCSSWETCVERWHPGGRDGQNPSFSKTDGGRRDK